MATAQYDVPIDLRSSGTRDAELLPGGRGAARARVASRFRLAIRARGRRVARDESSSRADGDPVRLQRYCRRRRRVAAPRRSIDRGRRRQVNGKIVREMGTSVVAGDVVEYGGRIVLPAAESTYLVMHKPLGVVTTMRDPEGRRTVADLLRRHAIERRVVPVGRLDYDTAGVLLLTDDGDLAHVLTHPRYGVEKTYRATLRGRLDRRQVEALRVGVRLEESRAQPARLRVIATRGDISVVDITIHEGRNRQVRRMFEGLGHPVVGLVRLRFGPVSLGELGPGEIRTATSREIAALRTTAAAAVSETAGAVSGTA